MKKILGLDIGTNSIGAALINVPSTFADYGNEGKIEWIGSRIIPLDGDALQKFESGGQVETKAAARRIKRGSRRLKQRYILRRSRLIKVLKILGWIDESFPENFKENIRNDPEFKFNISNYLPFEKSTINEATKLLGVRNKKGKLAVSEDWIIYYLRKKALKEEITLKEFSRIVYMMNQRRGFKSSRKDLKNSNVLTYDDFVKEMNNQRTNYDNNEGKELETQFVSITKIKSVSQYNDERDKKGNLIFTIETEDNRIKPWEEKKRQKPEWEGKEVTFLVLQKVNRKGEVSQNKPQIPKEDDWQLCTTALSEKIGDKYPGEFFFNELVKDKNYKIRQFPVYRWRYKQELEAIWKKQSNYHPELNDKSKLTLLANELYKNNESKNKEIRNNDLLNLISNDIIYYQRDLKSQKNLISGCRYEKKKYIKDGEVITTGVKVAPVSSPEFQEFRIWQDIHSLRIIAEKLFVNGKEQVKVDVTNDFINNKVKENLFSFFDSSIEISEQNIFKFIDKSNLSNSTHKINLYVNRKYLKGNETKELFRKIFRKFNYQIEGEKLLNDKITFYKLWHIIYSITSSDINKSEKGIITALTNSKNNFNLPAKIISELSKLPEPSKEYKSFSSRAINKLLEVIRTGRFWSKEQINEHTKERISKLLSGEFDDGIDNFTRDNIIKFFKSERGKRIYELSIEDFQGLPVWLACYVVYGNHSERHLINKFESHRDIDIMKLIPNNSLRNPIVEKVIRETLRIIKDVWERYGQPDEIHIELGRELKKNAEERKKISESNNRNRDEKERIKKILYELKNSSFEEYIGPEKVITSNFEVNPNPESTMDIEKFRIWKSCSGTNNEELDKLFKDGKKEKTPTALEIKKYTLWLSQKCISPYTGKVIQLSKLFTNEYAVEHIIPRSKLKYDSLENLVICESVINPDPYKGNKLARIFIRENSGKKLNINGADYSIFSEEDYIQHCKNIFKGSKLKNLLAEEIPEGFISRQLNDTRYITKKLNELLYPFAKEKEGLIFTIGSITSELKQNWKLNEIWKELLKQRFERLEKLMDKTYIYKDRKDESKFHFQVSDDPKFELKRIDHRHHALDALIVAATTREHVRYLSSLNAVDSEEELKNVRRKLVKGKIRDFIQPWPTFTEEAGEMLKETIVTFKSNNKVISKPKNKYLKWVENKGIFEKKLVSQKPNKKWIAVRKSMFKEPQGIIHLKEVIETSVMNAVDIQIERMRVQNTPLMKTASYVYDKELRDKLKEIIIKSNEDVSLIKKYFTKNPLKDYNDKEIKKIRVAVFKEFASKRDTVNKSFTLKKINNNIPYSAKSPIAELLRTHLLENNSKPNEAFEGEGLDLLNKKAIANPLIARPISKITRYEAKDIQSKFKNSYVEVDAGSIVYFVIYENEKTKVREDMYSLAVHQVIERIIQGKPIADQKEGFKIILLSPDDLVYVPTVEELENLNKNSGSKIDWSNKKNIAERIYKMVKSTNKKCFFIPNYISKLVIPYSDKTKKGEFESQNSSEKTIDGKQTIKNCFIKLKVDRLGNITPVL